MQIYNETIEEWSIEYTTTRKRWPSELKTIDFMDMAPFSPESPEQPISAQVWTKKNILMKISWSSAKAPGVKKSATSKVIPTQWRYERMRRNSEKDIGELKVIQMCRSKSQITNRWLVVRQPMECSHAKINEDLPAESECIDKCVSVRDSNQFNLNFDTST